MCVLLLLYVSRTAETAGQPEIVRTEPDHRKSEKAAGRA